MTATHESPRVPPVTPTSRQWEQMSLLDRAETALRLLEDAVRHEFRPHRQFSIAVQHALRLADMVLHNDGDRA